MSHHDWSVDCKVYVGGLGYGAEVREIEDAFSSYGTLKNVWVARNPPGFAFVEFADPRDATDACRLLDGTKINGRRVRVELSTGKQKQGQSGTRENPVASCSLCRSKTRSRSRSLSRSRSASRSRVRHRRRRDRSGSRSSSANSYLSDWSRDTRKRGSRRYDSEESIASSRSRTRSRSRSRSMSRSRKRPSRRHRESRRHSNSRSRSPVRKKSRKNRIKGSNRRKYRRKVLSPADSPSRSPSPVAVRGYKSSLSSPSMTDERSGCSSPASSVCDMDTKENVSVDVETSERRRTPSIRGDTPPSKTKAPGAAVLKKRLTPAKSSMTPEVPSLPKMLPKLLSTCKLNKPINIKLSSDKQPASFDQPLTDPVTDGFTEALTPKTDITLTEVKDEKTVILTLLPGDKTPVFAEETQLNQPSDEKTVAVKQASADSTPKDLIEKDSCSCHCHSSIKSTASTGTQTEPTFYQSLQGTSGAEQLSLSTGTSPHTILSDLPSLNADITKENSIPEHNDSKANNAAGHEHARPEVHRDEGYGSSPSEEQRGTYPSIL